jgi:hypothetical protein
MRPANEGSSLTGWLVEIGGGRDPSWASSIIRTVTAWIGVYLLYQRGLEYGDFTYLSRLVATTAAAVFTSSLAIKIVKDGIHGIARQRLIRIGRPIFVGLDTGQKGRLIAAAVKGDRFLRFTPETAGPYLQAGALILATSSDFTAPGQISADGWREYKGQITHSSNEANYWISPAVWEYIRSEFAKPEPPQPAG